MPNLALAPTASPARASEKNFATRLRELARGDLPQELSQLWIGLADVDAIFLRARVEVWVADSAPSTRPDLGTLGNGTFEYWGSGRKFHAKVQLPPSLGLTRFEEAASDGLEYRFFIADDGLLSVHGADHRQWLLPVPNPLFLPLRFLDPTDDVSEPSPELRLIDLRVVRPRLSERKVALGGETIPLSRRQVWGQELAQVRVNTWKGPRGLELSLEQQVANGRRITRTEMKNWNPVSGAPDLSFPWTLTYTVYDETGTWPLVYTTFLIEEIRASPSLPDETFVLNPSGIRSIWDEAKREFVY